jgi:hypothetical protein
VRGVLCAAAEGERTAGMEVCRIMAAAAFCASAQLINFPGMPAPWASSCITNALPHYEHPGYSWHSFVLWSG